MKLFNLLILTSIAFLYVSCDEEKVSSQDLFEVTIQDKKETYTNKDSFYASVINKKNTAIDSVVYKFNAERMSRANSLKNTSFSLNNQKLGVRTLHAIVYSKGKAHDVSTKFTILSSIVPKLYTYTILETYPHDNTAYTQGLEFNGDDLYESTGQYKKSTLRKTNHETGEVLENKALEDHYFGEGLTILNNKIYQLTWQNKLGFIYQLDTMEKTGSFIYGKSKEGWGLCNDGTTIYKSDGTQKIWSLDANTLAEEDYIEIYTNTSKIKSVNELEWVDGKIYANIYLKDAVAIVNPENGAVEGVIDFTSLKEQVTVTKKDDEVLNGIAYKGEENILYVTGKNWDKLFKVEIVEK